MISFRLPEVTLGEAQLNTIVLLPNRGEPKPPQPPKEEDFMLLENGGYLLYEDGSNIVING